MTEDIEKRHVATSLPVTGGTVPPRPTILPRRPRRRWVSIPVAIIVVLVLAVVISSRIDLNYYAVQPGTAQSVQQFITVPASRAHPVTHPVKLTDVELSRVSALTYLYFKLSSDTDLQPLESVTGGTPPSELNGQGDLEMSQAESQAKAAALRRLGYAVPATPAGAAVFAAWNGTPAFGVLHVGDVITAVDGAPTLTADALDTVLKKYHSGQTVTLSVEKGGSGKPQPIPITLKASTVDLGDGQFAHVTLGVQSVDQVDYSFPFPVSINVTNIGGPSAGLAMTLGVIDTLSGGNLTGNRTVAATGTMDDQGNVGDVGGVPQKTIAVERAGATIFLVPPQEYKAALSKKTPGLQIFAVSTLNQALHVLATHGGHVPAVTVPPGASG
ncbi:MAG TPA: S16 family serine protease [Acidimicrobiales bacterium]|jgi:PDZ domain-containing protein